MLTGGPTIFGVNPLEISDTQEHPYGTLGQDAYGDLYRYIKAGASNLVGGKLYIAPAPVTTHHNMALSAAAAAGDRRVIPTLGSTNAATLNQYAGGILVVSDATGEGSTYRIVGNKAAAADAVCEFQLESPLWEALTTSSEVTVFPSPYNAVVAAAAVRRPAGVPLRDITATYFGWVKTRGVVSLLADGAITVNNAVISSGSVAGAGLMSDVLTEATDASRLDDAYLIGRAVVAGVDTEYRPVDLCID